MNTGKSGLMKPKLLCGAFVAVTVTAILIFAGCADSSSSSPANIPVTAVTVDPTALNLAAGSTGTLLTATVVPADATDKTVTWASSNDAVATVADGVVTAKAGGSATITVTTRDGKKTATCAVTVTAEGTGVTLEPETLSLPVGKTKTLTATVTPADATDTAVTWASSNDAIATVDANGKVTAVAVGGPVTITVTTTGGMTAICAVTVTDSVKVYAAGSASNDAGNNHAEMWIDGVKDTTSLPGQSANSVFVSGGHVYVAGFDYNSVSGVSVATVWKNGTVLYSFPGTYTWALSVFVE